MSSHQAKRVKLIPTCGVCRRQNPNIRDGELQCVHCAFWNSICASQKGNYSHSTGRKVQEFEYSQRRAVESVPDEQLPHKLPNASSSNQDPSGADRALPPDLLNTQKET